MTVDKKEKVIAQQRAVTAMTVYKRRLPTDDGWEFAAALAAPGDEWVAATYEDLTQIAARALTGNY